MKRLTILLAGLVLALGTLPAIAPAQSENLRLTEAGGTSFPERSFLLTLPENVRLAPGDVVVTEDGKAVSDVSVVPASEVDDRRFGVVLAIDASKSMRGQPMEQAMAAARALAEHRNGNQEMAIVAFNSEATVVLPFTGDAALIDEALASAPALARGTRVYDAVDEALGLVAEADLASAAVVLLSDGADTGSATTLDAVTAAARDANVRVFTVGLESRQFDPSALRSVAEAADGRFTGATSADQLRPILDALGAELAAEYLVEYRSLAGPGAEVEVVARVKGFDEPVSTGYRTPELPGTPAAPSFAKPAAQAFWTSTWAMLLAAIAASVLVALAVAAALGRRRPGLVSRMSAFVSVTPRDGENERASLHDAVVTGTERSLARFRWWAQFCQEVEIGKLPLQPVQIVLFTACGTLFAVWVLSMLGGLVFAVLGLATPLVARSLVKRRVAQQRKLFAEQLPDNLEVLASAIRAGHSFVGALSVVIEDAADPARTEFRRAIADERLGVPLEDALDVVARRMESRELEQISVVAALQRTSGGNSAEVLDRVAETVRERGQLRRLVQTLTAQGRMARWIVSSLPVLLLVVLTLLNRAYMEPLFTEPLGRLALVVAGVMVFLGSLVIKRIVNIKV